MAKNLCSAFSRISLRAYAIVAEILLVLSSVALIAVDLAYGEAYQVRFGDLYFYVAIGGLIGLWTLLYGLYSTATEKRQAIRMYLFFVTCMVGLSIVLGIIHVILTFTVYRNQIVRSCVDHETNGLFWWTLGYQFSGEVSQVVGECTHVWSHYAAQRTLTWTGYSIVAVGSTWIVHRHYQSLKRQPFIDDDDEDRGSSSDAEEGMIGPETKLVINEAKDDHDGSVDDDEPPPTYEDAASVQHQQRQRLYDEIHKVHSRRRPDSSVHPLDPPACALQRPTSFYSSVNGSGSQQTSRPTSESSEKLDYDWYRSHQPFHRPSSLVDEDLGTAETGAESRRRPTSWRKRSSDKGTQ